MAREVAEARSVRAKDADGSFCITVRIALLVGADGQVRRLVPEAIDCPTAEQFSVGVIENRARGNLVPFAGRDTWFKTAVTFEWPDTR